MRLFREDIILIVHRGSDWLGLADFELFVLCIGSDWLGLANIELRGCDWRGLANSLIVHVVELEELF